MSSQIQTILALLVVAIAAIWLILRVIAKQRRGGSCGDDCGAISPEIRRLQAKLKKR
jgi:hypothetical protein